MRCRTLRRSVTEGNEKADYLAKAGAMLDEGFMAEARAETTQQEREEVYAALQYAASFLCLAEQWKDYEEFKPKPKEKWIFVDKKSEETKHRTEWCAEVDRYRCMSCGGGSKYMKMPGKCPGPKLFVKKFGQMGKTTFGKSRPRSELSQLSGRMEGLWRAQAEAKRKVSFRWPEKRGDETSNGMLC